MFDRDYELSGKHASYVKYLANSVKVFKRHIDVYMVGAILGCLQNRLADQDSSVEDSVRIFADTFVREKSKCEFIYRILMLLHAPSEFIARQRTDKAFREDADESSVSANMKVFNAYVRGGIEYLYEQFTENCTTLDDVLNRVYLFVERFKSDLECKSDEEIIRSVSLN